MLEVRILGPVAVLRDGREIDLPGERSRTLLALLLIRGGAIVASDRLVDELWDGETPANARKALQMQVSRLRRAIGGVVVSGRSGYGIEIEDGALDAARFERALHDAREESASGARSRLLEALALWHGPPLARTSDTMVLNTERQRLEELRLTAEEELADAELRLGLHADAIPRLERLVEADLYRERPRALLMRALYATGRQADALAVYREGSRALADDLGLEPSPALRELEAAILRHEVARSPVRFAPPPALIGRDRDIRAVTKLLAEARLVTLVGPAGVGKTRLAEQVVAQTQAAYRDGASVVPLDAVRDPDGLLPAIARAAGTREDAQLTDRRMLLVLDNFEQILDAAPAVSRLLATAPYLDVLVTSRAPLRIAGEREYYVPALAEPDAVALFVERAQAFRPDFAPPDLSTVRDICARLDGLPLAIELAAARLRVLSPGAILDRLDQRLQLLSAGGRDVPDRQRSLRAAIAWSHDLLPDRERAALARLAVFAGSFSLEAAEAVCDDALDVLTTLVEHSLVHATPPRFSLLEVIREFAAEQLVAPGEADAVARRHAEYYVAYAHAAAEAIRAGRYREWLTRLDDDYGNLEVALAWGRAHDEQTVLELATAVAGHAYLRGRSRTARAWLDDALRTTTGGDPRVRTRALRDAVYYAAMDEDVEATRANYAAFEEMAEGHADRWVVATLTWAEGLVLRAEKRHTDATAVLEQCAEQARAVGDLDLLGAALNNLGDLALIEGDPAKARRHLEAGLAAVQQGDLGEAAATVLANLAYALFGLGDLGGARARIDEVVELVRATGERDESVVYAAELIGAIAAREQRPADAATVLGAAEAACEALGRGLETHERRVHDDTVTTLNARLAPSVLAECWARGREIPLDEAIRLARG